MTEGRGCDRLSAVKRPRILRAVAERVQRGEQGLDPALREFLDYFYANPERGAEATAGPPRLLDHGVRDACLAAVAEYLARCYNIEMPAWSETRGLTLQRPFFAGGLESLKAVLIVESPTAFRRRTLSVSKDALSRPRMPPSEPAQ
jgi:hypothetical protein